MPPQSDPAQNPPVPDPTVLTTEALERAVDGVRDYVNGEIAVLAERLRGIDRATALLNESVNRVPTDVQQEVQHLHELMNERSQAVVTQFELIERQRVEQKLDTKQAVDAALAAAKEAVREQTTASQLSINKSETATAEQLKQLTVTFQTAINADVSAIADLKTRIERQENLKQGGQDNRASMATMITIAVAVIVASVAIANFLAS